MESANIHHHLQDQFVGSSSSSSSSLSAITSCYELVHNSTTTHAAWIPSSFLSTNSFTSYPNEANTLSSRQQENNTLLSSQYTSMSPDLSFHYAHASPNFTNSNQSAEDHLHLSRIKEEFSDNYYLKYTELLTSNPSSRTNDHHDFQSNDVGTKLLLKSSSSGNLMNSKIHGDNLYSNNSNISYGGGNNGRGFSQIFPSVNVSGLTPAGLTNNPATLDMNLEALDLLTSSRFSGNYFGPSSQNQMEILRDGLSYGFDHMQQLYGSNKISAASSTNGLAETKRSSHKMEPKPTQTAPKKTRLEGRASCPPFKVRKEKLGDRIAALQQLVAPFGKTDTASVLMEAIGYIKFLQNQVETLSVPYMKSSRNNSNARVFKGGPENENEEQKRDLKSRGLCLVPVTCLSYITDGGGAAVWPPPHFGGAT